MRRSTLTRNPGYKVFDVDGRVKFITVGVCNIAEVKYGKGASAWRWLKSGEAEKRGT